MKKTCSRCGFWLSAEAFDDEGRCRSCAVVARVLEDRGEPAPPEQSDTPGVPDSDDRPSSEPSAESGGQS
jgi:hypothetical protein